MDTTTATLTALFVLCAVVLVVTWYRYYGRLAATRAEGFQSGNGLGGLSMADLSTQALDAPPTTSELKNYYKSLLVFADADIRQQGTAGLRILADFRDRVFGRRNFRSGLTVDDFLGNYPSWLPPLDTTIKEPVPAVADAVMAEARMLAYLQTNYPQEATVDEQTGSTVRNLVQDFGSRFVFEPGETVQLPPDFLTVPLLQNWRNPVAVTGSG